jgi:phosphoglycolate phosphatase
MPKLLIFDKDGVILDLEATWLPVARAVAAHTASLIPLLNIVENMPLSITATDLLLAVGVDDAQDFIDPKGLFATGSFPNIQAKWQSMLPPDMIALDRDPDYQNEVQRIVSSQAVRATVPKGDVVTPLRTLYQEGYTLAVVTNDDENNALQSLRDLGIADLFITVIGANSGYGIKPEPYGLLHCCEVAMVLPGNSVMVGDTNADYGASLAAGCHSFICVADAYECRPHDNIQLNDIIPNLMPLPALLANRSCPSNNKKH